MAAGILAVALGSVFALNSQVVNSVRRGATASFASQVIQERIEQFRRAGWTELVSNYPPLLDDPNAAGYDGDADEDDGTVYVDDPYDTTFDFNLTDLGDTEPGLKDLMSTATASAAQLPNLIETVKLETYNPSNEILKAYTGQMDGSGNPVLDADGNPVTVDVEPFKTGGTPISITRSNGTVTVGTFNPLLVLSTTVRLTMTVTWNGTDNVMRKKEFVTLFTVEGDK